MTDTEHSELYLCWRVEHMPNPRPEAIIGCCDDCQCKIYMMPNPPTRMPKVCHPCGLDRMIAAGDLDELTFLPGAEARKAAH